MMHHHPSPHHVLGTVVEVADLAWDAIERRRHHKVSDYAHERCAALQGDLERERSENQRLRAALEEYEKAIQTLFEDDAIQPHQSESCPSDMYERLIKTVESPAFLEKLQTINENKKIIIDDPAVMEVEGDTMVNINLEDPSWWLWIPDDIVPNKVEEQCSLDKESYVIVTQEDIVEGIAIFMATYIASSPQAKSLTPKQLQTTLSSAFASMDRVKTIRKLWVAGKFMYTAASWGLAVYGFYTHRYILKAATKAVLASGRVLVRAP